MMSYTEWDFETENFTRSGLQGMAKPLKAFFLRLYLLVCQNCETLKVPTRAIFRPLIWNLADFKAK